MRYIIFLLIVIAGCSHIDNSENNTQVLMRNLDTPWGMDFLPDGRMIFTERPGFVNIYDGNVTRIAEINVSEVSEAGLLGVAVDPDFQENNFVYLYYTSDKDNRVSRFQLQNNSLFNETVIIDNIPNARFHDGGRIKFGPDNKLYITTGDATNPSSAQDVNSLAGKILRVNKEGFIPEDNPFGNYVYSYGHRNPQGLAWNEGRMYASEHGPNRNDEINLIIKGENYHWPEKCSDKADDNNLRCYTSFTVAPSGIAFSNDDLYVAGLRGTQLRKIEFAEDGVTIVNETEIFTSFGRIRNVVEHDGYLYIATNNRDGRGIPREGDDKIIRFEP
ncbi:MAG: PQQ-dependent sugar dehydrogenase [Nanoarchaeota archaeon]